jgi:hypothetical protein
MEAAELLDALLALAAEHDLPVRRISGSTLDGLGPSASGACVLRGRRLVLLCAADPLERQLEILARALREHAGEALDGRFLPPALRVCLEKACADDA